MCSNTLVKYKLGSNLWHSILKDKIQGDRWPVLGTAFLPAILLVRKSC